MNRKSILGLSAALALFSAFPITVQADDEAPAQEKNWSLTIGAKGWLNEWSTVLGRYEDEEGRNQLALQSTNSKFSAIPFVSLGVGKWRMYGSYFTRTSYKFNTLTDVYNNGGSVLNEQIDTKAKRSEWDFNLGYQFNRHFLVSLGYKQIDKDVYSLRTLPGTGFYFFENPLRKQKASGPMLSMSANGDLTEGGRVKLFASAALGSLKMKTKRAKSLDSVYCGTAPYAANPYCNAQSFSENQFYNNLEAGFIFAPHRVPLIYSLGYRYQSLRGTNKIASGNSASGDLSHKSSDILRGYTFGMSYTF